MPTLARRVALGALVVGLLSGCGSTVQLQGTAAQGGGLSDGLSGPSGAGTTTGGSGLTGSDGGGSLAPGGSSLGGGTGSSLGSSGRGATTGTTPGRVRPGGTATHVGVAGGKPVEVGVILFPDVSAAAQALGGGSVDTGDQQAEADAAIGWINAHGGFAGHRVSAVYYSVELTSTKPYSQTYQEICSKFTEDHHVVATFLIGNAEAGLPACLAKGHSLFVGHGHYLRDQGDYRTLSNVVTANDVASDRVVRAMVDQMVSQGKVKKGDTLGLLHMDYNGPRHGAALMAELLKPYGVSVQAAEIPYPQSTPDISNSAAAVQSAELKMASTGVKTVAFLCPGCVSFFVQDAESQSYYPDYVLSSFDTLTGYLGKGHTKSFDGSIAVAWDPMRDVGTYTHPADLAGNSTHTTCKAIEKSQIKSDQSEFAATALCGGLLDIYAAVQANPTSTVTWTTLMAGFEALGTTHPGVANFSTRLGPQHHDGVASYRTAHYDPAQDAFVYDNATLHAFA